MHFFGTIILFQKSYFGPLLWPANQITLSFWWPVSVLTEFLKIGHNLGQFEKWTNQKLSQLPSQLPIKISLSDLDLFANFAENVKFLFEIWYPLIIYPLSCDSGCISSLSSSSDHVGKWNLIIETVAYEIEVWIKSLLLRRF